MAAVASIVVFVVLALSAGLLHVPAVRQFALSQGSDYLQASQQIDLQAGKLDYNLFTLKSTLTNVKIRSVEPAGSPYFFEADSVFVDLRLSALLRGRLEIQDARVTGGRISYLVDEGGVSNLPRGPDSDETQGSDPNAPLPVLIEKFDASGPAIVYEDRQSGQAVELPSWSLSIRGERMPQSHLVDFKIGEAGEIRLADRAAPLDELAAALRLRAGELDITRLRLRTGASELDLDGKISDFAEPAGDLNARLKAEIEPLLELAGMDLDASGDLELTARITEKLSAPRLQATVSGSSLAYEDYREMTLAAEAAWAAGDNRAVISSFSLDAPFARLRGDADLALEEAAGDSRLALSLEQVDLARLSRPYDPPMVPAARAKGSLETAFPGLDFEQARGEARLRLTPTRASAAKDVLPLAGSLNARLDGNRITASLSGLTTLGMRTSGNIVLTDFSGLGGSIEIDVDSLEETIVQADLLLDSPSDESIAPTALAGALRATVGLGGTIDAPRATILSSSDNLSAGDLEGIAFRFDGAYSPEEALIEALNMSWREKRIEVAGRVGLEGDSPQLEMTASSNEISLSDALAALGREEPVTGELSFSANISGTAAEPQGAVTVNASNLEAYGQVMGALSMDASLADGVATVAQLRLIKPDGGILRASGSYRLDDGYFEVDADSEGLELESLTLPSGDVVRGAVELSINGRGTAEAPELNTKIQVVDLHYGEMALGDIDLGAEVAGGSADLTVGAEKFSSSLQARIGVESPHAADLKLTIDSFALETLEIEGRGDKPLQGVVDGVITARGNLDDPENFAVEADFAELSVSTGGVKVRNEGPLRLAYRDRRVVAENVELISGRSSVRLAGSLPLTEAGGEGELTIAGAINLEAAPALAGMELEELFVLGILNLEGVVGGSLERLEPNLTAVLEDGVILSPATIQPITAIQMKVTANQQRLELESLTAEYSRAKISAGGGVPMELIADGELPLEVFAQRNPAVFNLTVDGLDLEVLDVIPDGGGRVSLAVKVEAPELKAEAVTAELTVGELNIQIRDLRLQQAEPIRLAYQKGLMEIASFHITGPETNMEAAGTANVADGGALDLSLNVRSDAAVAGYLMEDLRMRGPVTANFTVGGTLEEPDVRGRLDLANGGFSLESPRFDADQLQIAIAMEGDRVEIETLTAALNGGRLEIGGGLSLADGIRDVDINISAKEVYLDFPEGLQTVSNADLRFHDAPNNLLRLDGKVVIQDGSFRERVDLGSDVLSMLGGRGLSFAEEPDPLLSRIRYAVQVDTYHPILVDNNLARMEASFDLRVVGSYYRPSLLGRVELGEGGQVFLAENEYVIETGVVDFTSETRIRPSLNLSARTQVAGHEITLLANGDGDDLSTQFTSDSGLSEPDIISLLLTGRTLEEAQESGLNIASQQALSYLTGSLGGRLGRAAEESLGLSRVRVEPNLISAEGDPSARLTIGQDITRQLNLIYSMNLTDSSDQIFVTEYDVTRRFNARGVKQSDNTYRFDFRHDVRWGLQSEENRGRRIGPRIEIASLEFEGEPMLDDQELQKRVGMQVGDRYDFFKARKRTDRLQNEYYKEDRLESRVRLRREQRPEQQAVDLTFRIEAGPRVQIAYDPVQPPGGVQKQVREAWSMGVFEAQRVDDSKKTLQRWLYHDGYLEAEIDHQIEITGPDLRTVRFLIRPGVRYRDVELVFQGNSGLNSEMLELALVRTELRDSLKSNPRAVVNILQRYYYQEGWLDAVVQRPEFELEPDTGFGRAVIAIDEGRRYQIGELSFTGAAAIEERILRAAVTPSGERAYTPQYLEESIQNVEEAYWERGYNDVLVNFTLTRRRDDARVDVAFELTENQQDVIKEVIVEGNEQVNEKLIRGRLANKEGDLLITEDNDSSRRRLYQTSAFALVDLQKQPLEDPTAPAGQNPLRLLAKVREVSPFRVRYGAFFDTERGPGTIIDFQNRNTLGAARSLGFRGRYDNQFREARGYFNQPLILNRNIATTSALFTSRELRQTFVTDRTGVSVQQKVDIGRRAIFQYGYRFEKTHTFDRDEDAFIPLDLEFNLAPLTSTFTYDSRDDILDATHGRFFSHGLEYAPGQLGSDVRYWKYFGQYFHYFPFFKPTVTPFDRGGMKRPKLIYATGVRTGLARGLGGQSIVPSERFFAGGGTTIRGFAQDTAGPLGFFGDPEGGEAVFVLNNEARFPLKGIFEGVSFLDVGNVYSKISDFNPTSLRSTAGLGLRIRTPFFLLRLDYGWKLDRKPDEGAGEFFFSIGQAF